MSDLKKQIRVHYNAQKLPPEKVSEILARARGGDEIGKSEVTSPERRNFLRPLLAIAAMVALAITGAVMMKPDTRKASLADLYPTVIGFFQAKSPLVPAPESKEKLREWLLAQGAPPEFEIPEPLQDLENAACQVLDVKGRKAYLSCYWRVQSPDRGDQELIHLLVARTSDFKDIPASDTPQVKELDGWSFASWKDGPVVYTLATATPREKLLPYISYAGDFPESLFIGMIASGAITPER